MAKTSSKANCPICEKPAAKAHAPFCSPRCKDVDLNRWLSGGYAIPGNDADDERDTVPEIDVEKQYDEGFSGTRPVTRH